MLRSALDTDFYLITQQQASLHQHPDVMVRYKYKLRNPEIMKGVDIGLFYDHVMTYVDHLCNGSRYTQEELDYLRLIPFLTSDYIDFLEDFTLKRRFINIEKASDGIDLEIAGPEVQVGVMETPLLALISEIYSQMRGIPEEYTNDRIKGMERLKEKVEYINSHMSPDSTFKFVDFGTRRRLSYKHHQDVIEYLVCNLNPKIFVGTSNVHFARKFGIKPIGTMAHKWFQIYQALVRVSDSVKESLEAWAREYRGSLGIALSDIVGFDAFLRDFDPYFAKLFDGCRHDSGNPYVWGNKLIAHYENLGIDPMTKAAVFSDGLSIKEAMKIEEYFRGRINTSFGIGTSLTNDCGFVAPQIVIKMVECNGKPVAKISDSPGKGMCEDEDYLYYLKSQFKIGE